MKCCSIETTVLFHTTLHFSPLLNQMYMCCMKRGIILLVLGYFTNEVMQFTVGGAINMPLNL